jgi:hypothetical protein
MRRTTLTILGVVDFGIFTRDAAAAERQLATNNMDHAAVTEQFLRSNGSVISPSVSPEYYEGRGFSAPAGRS